jgi:gamma-butyrobetaine dioxygenase
MHVLRSTQRTVLNCSRLCSRVQCRRRSTQTPFPHLRRWPAALPRRSRETALISQRFFSATQCDPSLAQNSKSADETAWKLQEAPDGPDLNLLYVKIGEQAWHPVFLRDACTCPFCVDPSSKQKNFQTTDIPARIEAKSVEQQPNGDLAITWTKDAPGFGKDHVSRIPATLLQTHQNRGELRKARYTQPPATWSKKFITERLEYIDFHEYMHDEQRLWHALKFLHRYGILLVRGVPDDEHAIEKLTGRIGRIRDTFYGRTWDVKSVLNARNVAYTPQHLGLHMDLLYMQNPPGFQFLHCLKNTSPGGTSLFSDALAAAHSLPEPIFHLLATQDVAFEYRNDGQHYYYERPVLEVGKHNTYARNFIGQEALRPEVLNINWSPPFQAPLPYQRRLQGAPLPKVLQALRSFAHNVQHPAALYEYRLNEGECVIFNNRRVLHGRTAFDTTQGERWLKGTYIDTDVFQSRLRVLYEQLQGTVNLPKLDARARYVHPDAARAWQERKEIAAMLPTDEGASGTW